MRIVVSGASGLIGRTFVSILREAGHEAIPLSRKAKPGGLTWDLAAGRIDPFENVEAVVHLAGESVAGRWTDERKRRILESRIRGTTLIAQAAIDAGVSTFISASATGFYGNRGDAELSFADEPGDGFLADVCVQWEAAAQPARDAGLRVAHPRIGVVFDADDGALAKMKTPFKMGVGGKVGDGSQFMPWVHIQDMARILAFAVEQPQVTGAFNACTGSITNAELTRALGAVLSRPTVVPLPRFAARLAMGREMADQMLLISTRAVPKRLVEWGFEFRHPELLEALSDIFA